MILLIRNLCCEDLFNIGIYRFIQTKIYFIVCISMYAKNPACMHVCNWYHHDIWRSLDGSRTWDHRIRHHHLCSCKVLFVWHQLNRPDKHREKHTHKHTGWKRYHLAITGNKYGINGSLFFPWEKFNYREISYISRPLVGNKIVDRSDLVGVSPVGPAPTTSSFST